jgi:hypothetical protein
MGHSPTFSPNEIARSREQLERSGLLKTAQDVCDSINKKAGGLVIDSHSYLPPQPIVCAFIVANGDIEYVMQISVRHSKALLVFLKRKWRDGPSYDLVRWLSGLFRRSNAGPRIRLEREILAEAVSSTEIESWFAYLVSGLKRRLSP